LVGAIGEMWAAEQRESALRSGIDKGGPAVRQILNLLEADVLEAIKLLRSTGEHQRLADRVRWYNRHRAALGENLEARRALLDDIDSAVKRQNAVAMFDPERVIRAIRDANEALLNLASSPRGPKNIDQFAASMELFAARISGASASARGLAGKGE
jgi:hypothetical protein